MTRNINRTTWNKLAIVNSVEKPQEHLFDDFVFLQRSLLAWVQKLNLFLRCTYILNVAFGGGGTVCNWKVDLYFGVCIWSESPILPPLLEEKKCSLPALTPIVLSARCVHFFSNFCFLGVQIFYPFTWHFSSIIPVVCLLHRYPPFFTAPFFYSLGEGAISNIHPFLSWYRRDLGRLGVAASVARLVGSLSLYSTTWRVEHEASLLMGTVPAPAVSVLVAT
jgi:hypothetical protein